MALPLLHRSSPPFAAPRAQLAGTPAPAAASRPVGCAPAGQRPFGAMPAAVNKGILRRLTPRHAASSISLFADDVVIFCHPDPLELEVVRKPLQFFGDATGLRTSFAKCSASPVQCSPAACEAIGAAMACPVKPFPITYLGLPLSIRKAPSSMLLPLVERMSKKLATWKASLLSLGERLSLARHVLSAMHVHILLAMAINPPILKKIIRIIRDLLWHGRKDAKASACLVSWARICRPLALGGLGIRDLHRTGIALCTRWLSL
ncbi:uncharacterized protein [Aegilops tauschii subsp. strangulata]|uniref:uncharacterized protein n=1 Tax=Aegilops tauschii subsp. strangulata TaxID=200361 RepID=UPI003CC88C11